ncbi:MAG TPA: alkyl sulfatase C-terminal domain-containing protein [Mycobacterium sp.]
MVKSIAVRNSPSDGHETENQSAVEIQSEQSGSRFSRRTAIQLGKTTIDDAANSNNLKIGGNRDSFNEFIGLLDASPFWFNIVTPYFRRPIGAGGY